MNSIISKKITSKATLAGVLTIAISITGMLAGCEANNIQNGTNVLSQQKTIQSDAVKQENNQMKIMEDYKALLTNNKPLLEIVKFMDKNISLVSSENATVMVNGFEEMQKKYLPKFEGDFNEDIVQTQIRKVYIQDFDINKIDGIEDIKIKGLLSEVRDSGYKVETAEGMFFPVINYEFYKRYSSYVTSDIREYIDLIAVESNQMPAKDAALVITWDEIVKRILNQENFISKNGSSMKAQQVKDLNRKYLVFALFGANNTPLFSYDSKIMVPEAKKAYMDLLKNNKESDFLKNINGFMELLKKTDYKLTDEIDKYRKGIIEKLK